MSARGLSRVWSGGLGGIDLPTRAVPAKPLSRITPLISKRQSFVFLKWPFTNQTSAHLKVQERNNLHARESPASWDLPLGFWTRGCSPARARGGPCPAAASVESEAGAFTGENGKGFSGKLLCCLRATTLPCAMVPQEASPRQGPVPLSVYIEDAGDKHSCFLLVPPQITAGTQRVPGGCQSQGGGVVFCIASSPRTEGLARVREPRCGRRARHMTMGFSHAQPCAIAKKLRDRPRGPARDTFVVISWVPWPPALFTSFACSEASEGH